MSTYIRACALGDLPAHEGAVQVRIEGLTLALARTQGQVFAVDDTCTHAEVSLSAGEVVDGEIECWLHGSRFDLRSGQPTCLPATEPVPVYPVKIDGDDILVDVAAHERETDPIRSVRQ